MTKSIWWRPVLHPLMTTGFQCQFFSSDDLAGLKILMASIWPPAPKSDGSLNSVVHKYYVKAQNGGSLHKMENLLKK
jgi:hypothetical protein